MDQNDSLACKLAPWALNYLQKNAVFILTVSQFLGSHDAKSALVLLTKQFFTWQREFLKIRRRNEKYFNLVHAHKPKFGLFKSMTSQVVQRPRPLIICICVVSTQRVNSFTKVGHKTRSKSNKWDHSIGTVVDPVLWNGLATEQSFNLIGSFSLLALWTN